MVIGRKNWKRQRKVLKAAEGIWNFWGECFGVALDSVLSWGYVTNSFSFGFALWQQGGSMTYKELYDQGKRVLDSAGVMEAELDARLLLEYVCETNRNDLLVHGDRVVESAKQEVYEDLIGKRGKRIPLQYLTGVQNFMGLDFCVDSHVLIPRQDTEVLVEEVLRNLHDGMHVLDMCTGSGCILISLLHYTNHCDGLGVDISEEALTVARRNSANLLPKESDAGAEEGFGRICFLQSDLFQAVEGKFDVIVSNPPYISSQTMENLMPEVGEYEPRLALDGGSDGLMFYRRILEECREYLFGGGMLFFEIGQEQAEAVSNLMEQAGFLEIQVVKDYAGLDRVVFGTMGFREPEKVSESGE